MHRGCRTLATLALVIAALLATVYAAPANPPASPPKGEADGVPSPRPTAVRRDVYALSNYLNIRGSSAPSISPDGRRIAYLSNKTGTAQIWMVDTTGGTPHNLTNYPDRITFVAWSPDGTRLAFGKDSKGNERTQIFVLDPNTGAAQQITTDDKAIHTFGGWSRDGSRMAWSSNARNQAFFDVYIHDFSSAKTPCVLQGDETYRPVAWSPDGRQLIVARDITNLDNELWLLEIATGSKKLLTPHKGEADYSSVHWPVGGDTLYLITNQDSDFANLASLDVNTPGTLRVIKPLPTAVEWDVTDIVVSRTGNHIAVATNEDGYGTLVEVECSSKVGPRVFPPRASAKVALPPGVPSGLSMSADGRTVAVGWLGPQQPPAIWVAPIESREQDSRSAQLPITQPRAVTQPDLNGIPADSLVAPKLVHFPTFDGRKIPGYLYEPKTPGRHPVVVSVHGGPEAQERPVWSGVYQYFVHRGYAIFAPNIRGSLGYGKVYTHLDDARKRGDAIEDVAWGVKYLKSLPTVIPDKIAVMGGSYGGYMTLAQVAFHPELYAAAVDIVGISNFETFLKNTGAWRVKYRIAEYGDPEKDKEYLYKFSPIHKVEAIRAPLMVIQGAQDPRVPKSEADQMVASLKALGRPVEYLVFEDEGHGLARLDNRIKAYTAIADFFDKYLGKPQK